MRRASSIMTFCLLAALVAACDTVTPVDDSRLVVEGFLNTGMPLPIVEVRRTLSPRGPYDAQQSAVEHAAVRMEVDGAVIHYEADDLQPGSYRPVDAAGVVPAPGAHFRFRAAWRDEVVEAIGIVPPEIRLTDVSLVIPSEPVSAVLLDSLALTDSLATGAYTGFIYPIEVSVTWEQASAAGWQPEDSWIRAQLKPISLFRSPVVDLFLRSDAIFREMDQPLTAGHRRWTGVYAVGVPRADSPLPEHRLRVALVRSGPDYARFAASRDAPERREPIANVSGGVGIIAAVAVDSTHVTVAQTGTTADSLPAADRASIQQTFSAP